jgi:hypothetical protein
VKSTIFVHAVSMVGQDNTACIVGAPKHGRCKSPYSNFPICPIDKWFFPLIGMSLRNNQRNFLSEIWETFRLARYKRSVTLSHLTRNFLPCLLSSTAQKNLGQRRSRWLDWKMVTFSDESHFELHFGNRGSRCRRPRNSDRFAT